MKRFLFAFGLWTNFLSLFALGTVKFTGIAPDWVPVIKDWAFNLVIINTMIMTALQGYPGLPSIKMPDGVKTAAAGAAAFALILLGLPGTGVAADLLTTKVPAFSTGDSPCLINNCTGWYAGVGLTGNGTNADIIGSGLSQSVFAAGGQFDVHGGYQFWNGTYFAAAEVGLGYQFENGAAVQVKATNITGYEILKFGGSLSGILNTSASPITIPTVLSKALISPYFAIGAVQHQGVSQWATGAGADFLLATNWDLDLRYLYAPAVNGVAADNLVTIGLNRHF